ncbi:MAG TPA: hypothetical protein VKA15_06810 [Isosphaeraceae bacterium]|nr:hypothetical protein [Isosphaeraceae bacterium]
MVELGIGHLEIDSVVRLYRNTVTIGRPHNPDRPAAGEIEVEVGTKNDRDHCMDVIDALLAPFPHSRSCGLARVARFASVEDFMTFSRHLSLALLAGYYAERYATTERDCPRWEHLQPQEKNESDD